MIYFVENELLPIIRYTFIFTKSENMGDIYFIDYYSGRYDLSIQKNIAFKDTISYKYAEEATDDKLQKLIRIVFHPHMRLK